MYDERYSTTRLLVTNKPKCFDSLKDGAITLLKTPSNEKKIAEGGLRCKGFFKSSSKKNPLVTVVTVVFNDKDNLEKTINSVISQDYQNVEYIIVDGGSTDGTLEIIQKYEFAIDYWVSEPDGGIYDAMNKGIDLGSGDWINFMNSGDRFIGPTVLSNVSGALRDKVNNSVIYGDHEVRYAHKKRIVSAGGVRDLWKGSLFCHQAAFVDLSHHKRNKFNVCRKIAADFEFFYKSYRSGLGLIRIPHVISTVSGGGVSDVRRVESILEQWMVVEKTTWVNTVYILRLFVENFKDFIKKRFGMA